MSRTLKTFIVIFVLTAVSGLIALPPSLTLSFPSQLPVLPEEITIGSPVIDINLFGREIHKEFVIKQGLDIQGGIQVVLKADMSEIPEQDKLTALESVREIILTRVDLYGISEPSVQTAISGDDYRLLVALPGVDDPQEALDLVGRTAQLDFRLLKQATATNSAEATDSAELDEATMAAQLAQPSVRIEETGLTGQQLNRSSVQFDPNTGEPVVMLEFNEEGRELFADITSENTGEMLGIFIDNSLIMAPRINQAIINGQATITGGFTLDEAKQLNIQLNAGALPVPIEVLEQRTVGASLGQTSVQHSIEAGLIGLGLVMTFMMFYYGLSGLIASLALVVYAILTMAIYKTFGVTLTLPGIAGLLLSIGMAVDANILIFERMKEELRVGKPFERAMELGFGRAWDSIKDANLATIITALILINPLNFNFLNTSGSVRGFGITLLIGVLLSLFTGVVVTRTFMRLFLKSPKKASQGAQSS